MTDSINLEEILEAAKKLGPLILEHRNEIEESRRLPDSIVQGMADLGIFRSMVPISAGGEEWSLPVFLRVIEELSKVDGAVGWVAGVGGAVNAFITGWISDELITSLLGDSTIGLVAGAGRPSGTARVVDEGYVVSGQWQFASASQHASGLLCSS